MTGRPIVLLALLGGRILIGDRWRPLMRRARPTIPTSPAPGPARLGTRHFGQVVLLAFAVTLVCAAAVATTLHLRHRSEASALAARLAGGDPARGPELARLYGCAGCHEVPGVQGPSGRVGPSLAGLAGRVYLGGHLPNTPANLALWIENPRAVDPRTAMPLTGISAKEARDMAAYLLSRS